MKPCLKSWIALAGIALISLDSSTGCDRKPKQPQQLTPVRIGWQIPLATQGQIVQVLKRTDLLESHGLEGTFVPFSYGGPQSEAALAGQLDVIFVGDQPAINLLARGGKWKIVSRLFYTKTAIMVPPNSPIHTVADLKGKTVASPFGSVAHREATLKEKTAGLDPDKDVKNVNLDILEISSLVQAGGDTAWGNIDAVAVWEPSTSLFELRKYARIVDYTRTLGVVAISDDFLTKYPDASIQFLEAVLKAWAYFAARTAQVNEWYVQDAKLSYTPDVLAAAALVEPNYHAKSLAEVDLSLTDEHAAVLESGAAWSFERGFSKTLAPVRQALSTYQLQRAREVASKGGFNVNAVRIMP